MEIRRTNPSDEDEICRLYIESWKAGYRGLLPQKFLDELSGDRWKGREFLRDEGSFVITESGKILGHVHIRPAEDSKMQGWGEVHTMYVLPGFWGKGYGSELFRYALNRLKEQGFSRVYLWVLQGNERAMGFYAKHGFRETSDTLECEVGGALVTDIRFIKEQ